MLLIGAWCARCIAKKQAEGFIEMGSFFDFYSDILSQYPKPVLSLSGRLDGQLKFASMANHAEPEMRDVNTYVVKPVIIISRVNHAQFSYGIPSKERGDLGADFSIKQACHSLQIFTVMGTFINIGKPLIGMP